MNTNQPPYGPGFRNAHLAEQTRLLDAIEKTRACFCVGRQNGEPLCPCRMKTVKVINGRYVETIDHGPAGDKS